MSVGKSVRSLCLWVVAIQSLDKPTQYDTSGVRYQDFINFIRAEREYNERNFLALSLSNDCIWTASSEFGTYRLCEQRRFRRACASAQSRQNLRCSLIQAVIQEEPSDRKPDPWPFWMAGHAQLQFVMAECSKTQIRLTGLICHIQVKCHWPLHVREYGCLTVRNPLKTTEPNLVLVWFFFCVPLWFLPRGVSCWVLPCYFFTCELPHDKTNKLACASSEDSDLPSLIRVFAVRMKKDWALSYPVSAQRRLWSDWAVAQADRSLRWARSPFVDFVVKRPMFLSVLFSTVVIPLGKKRAGVYASCASVCLFCMRYFFVFTYSWCRGSAADCGSHLTFHLTFLYYRKQKNRTSETFAVITLKMKKEYLP